LNNLPIEDHIDSFCFLERKGMPCVKSQIDKKHLPYYACEKCIWHIHMNNDREIKALERLFEKYGMQGYK